MKNFKNQIPKAITLAILIMFMPLSQGGVFDSFPKPRVEGDLKEIPYEKWQDTESGRFAHSLQYEDRLAKPVPYNFGTKKDYRDESEAYFEHLCATEGKDYIYKTAKSVDSIAQLRSFEIPFVPKGQKSWDPQYYKFHPYALEAPLFFDEVLSGLINNEMRHRQEIERVSFDALSGFYGIPYTNYEIKFNNGNIYNFKYDKAGYAKTIIDGKINPKIKDKDYQSIQKVEKITAKYGFTWRGISRPQDRDYGIAGGDFIILDLETNEIMAIQRSFIKGIIQNNSPTGLNWEGVGCFEQYKNDSLYSKLDFTNKSFFEKVKMIHNSSPQSSSSSKFFRTVLSSRK